MFEKQNFLACAVLIGISGFFGSALAENAPALPKSTVPESTAPHSTAPGPAASVPAVAQPFPGRRISLAPLPVEIYLLDKQKPTVVFTTPCVQIEKMTNGFPPILAFENFMFTWIENVNESNILPVKLEPVCI
ncbi:MAG: hypothetical protein WCA45_09760 [Thiobacillaceae bacterium]